MSIPDLNLEKHYELKLNTNPKLYKYDSFQTENIVLFGHQELPQGFKYIQPRLSNDENYLSSIAQGTNYDYVYIWKMSNLDSYLYKYEAKDKIEGVEFAPNNKSFIVIYKHEPPVHYNIASGKKIVIFKPTGDSQSNTLAYSFSDKSRFFGLATEDNFTVWDALTGKIVKNFIEKSPYKIIRNDTLISIDNNLNVKVIDFENKNVRQKFQINNVKSYDLILASILSPDNNFIFALEDGIYEINLENGNIEKIINFKERANKVIISDNCKSAFSTNYINLTYWNLEDRKEMGIIFKEQFYSFTINFEKGKIVTSNEICINIFKYNDEKPDEKFIWLNLNVDKFNNFTFSPDQKVILGIIDEYNAILYNCETGRIIKKFNNKIPEWSISCKIVPETAQVAILATKYNENLIKIWNYYTGTEIITLEGFNTHSFCFNDNGSILACGAKSGNEIARVWDLNSDNNFYNSYIYEGNNNNKNTLVHLIQTEENEKLICCSQKQKPVVFDLESKEFLYVCESPYLFEKIEDIQSDSQNKFFMVKGIDEKGVSNAALFDLSDGTFIEQYDNCFNIDFSKENILLLSRSININNNKLVISNFENLNDIKRINCEMDAGISNFIQDNRVIVSAFGNENKIDFIISDINNGKIVAELKYNKKVKNHAELDLSANKEENTLVFRYIEFINPERI
jgi:hypothetical protein